MFELLLWSILIKCRQVIKFFLRLLKTSKLLLTDRKRLIGFEVAHHRDKIPLLEWAAGKWRNALGKLVVNLFLEAVV